MYESQQNFYQAHKNNANHQSFLDSALIGLNENNFSFITKSNNILNDLVLDYDATQDSPFDA